MDANKLDAIKKHTHVIVTANRIAPRDGAHLLYLLNHDTLEGAYQAAVLYDLVSYQDDIEEYQLENIPV